MPDKPNSGDPKTIFDNIPTGPPDESQPRLEAAPPSGQYITQPRFDTEGYMNTVAVREFGDLSKESERMIQEAIVMEEQRDKNNQTTVEKIDNLRKNTTLNQGVNYLFNWPIRPASSLTIGSVMSEPQPTIGDSGQPSGDPDADSASADNGENDPGLEVSEEAEPDEPYLVRGALLHCRNGSHDRRLNLPLCHGVYSTKHPLITRLDCIPGDDQNIPSFGVCSSGKNPSKEEVILESYVPVGVMGERQGESDGTVKGPPCVPVIVGTWLMTADKNRIVDNGQKDPGDRDLGRAKAKGQPMVTMHSLLVCKYGGLIEPINCGQEFINQEEHHSLEGDNDAKKEACETEGIHAHGEPAMPGGM